MSLLQTSKIVFASKLFVLAFFSFIFFASSHSAFALTISPAKIEVSGDPGQTVGGSFLIINEEDKPMTFYVSAENFEAQGETGSPHFTGSEGGDLASWINSSDSVTLEKGGQSAFDFTITIPKDATPGGHFAAVFLSNTPPVTGSSSAQVSVGAKIGVLVLLRVKGDVAEGGGITSFSTENKGHFFSSLPISFVYYFKNDGGDRVRPMGELRVKNILGWTKKAIPGNESQGNVLPSSTRKFNVVWGESEDILSHKGFFGTAWYQLRHFAFGVYKANLSLNYGEKENTTKASHLLVVIPWQLLIVVIIILGVLFKGGGFLLARYNKWIIAKASVSVSQTTEK